MFEDVVSVQKLVLSAVQSRQSFQVEKGTPLHEAMAGCRRVGLRPLRVGGSPCAKRGGCGGHVRDGDLL